MTNFDDKLSHKFKFMAFIEMKLNFINKFFMP